MRLPCARYLSPRRSIRCNQGAVGPNGKRRPVGGCGCLRAVKFLEDCSKGFRACKAYRLARACGFDVDQSGLAGAGPAPRPPPSVCLLAITFD